MVEDGVYEMTFPKSAVLYLRHTENTPDKQRMKIHFTNGETVEYEVPIIKAQRYTARDIIDRKLYFLMPFYILRYEKVKDMAHHDDMVEEYNEMYAALEKACEEDVFSEYDAANVREFTDKLIKYVAGKNVILWVEK